MPNYPYRDLILRIARTDWGRSFPSVDDAERAMIGDADLLGASAATEMLRVLMKAVEAAHKELTPRIRNKGRITLADDAQEFPGIKVGDLLYTHPGAGDGLETHVVVGVTHGKYAILASELDEGCDEDQQCWYARGGHYYRTPQEALAHAVDADLGYHGTRVEWAMAAKAALDSGGDITPFLEETDVDALTTPSARPGPDSA